MNKREGCTTGLPMTRYNMCIGRGGTHEKCKNIPMDAHITPQNPLPTVTTHRLLSLVRHIQGSRAALFLQFRAQSLRLGHSEGRRSM